MARKLYTVDVEDENLTNSASSKTTKLVKSSAEKEVESFGIVEINNNSSKKRVKSTKDLGFEKNNTACAKKSVKSKVHEVEDYFDFSFRPTQKVATKKVASKPASTTKKIKKIEEVAHRQIIELAEACDRPSFDETAEKIVSVARMGSLFE